jgi:aryl-alcohol dehydrogenase-like predicted oxidoreductase
VCHIGVSNFSVDQLKRAQAIAPVASLQPPYAIVRRDIEESILPYCAEQQIGVIVYSPMASGMLSGRMTRERVQNLPADDWRQRNPEFQEPRLTRNLALAERFGQIAGQQGATAGAAAVAWVLRHPAVTAAIVGARRPDQIGEIVAAATLAISANEAADLEAMAAPI